MAVFATLGAILALIGALMFRRSQLKHSSFQSFTAEVLGFRSEYETVGDSERELLCTIVSCKDSDKEFRASHEGLIPAENVPYKRGDTVTVHIDPQSPDKFLFSNEVSGTSAFGAALIAGGLLTVVFHILWGLLF